MRIKALKDKGLSGNHFTKVDRAAIEYMLANNVNCCASNRIRYDMKRLKDGSYKLTREEFIRDWGGRKKEVSNLYFSLLSV